MSTNNCRHSAARILMLDISTEGDISARVMCGNLTGGRGCGKIIGQLYDDIGNADVGQYKRVSIGKHVFQVYITAIK